MGKKTRRGKRHRDFPELPAGANLRGYFYRLAPDTVTKNDNAAIAARQAGLPSRPILNVSNARNTPVPAEMLTELKLPPNL